MGPVTSRRVDLQLGQQQQPMIPVVSQAWTCNYDNYETNEPGCESRVDLQLGQQKTMGPVASRGMGLQLEQQQTMGPIASRAWTCN